MLIIGYRGIGKTFLADKYNDKVIEIIPDEYREDNSEWLITFIEIIKEAMSNYSVVLLPYVNEVILGLQALNIDFYIAYPDTNQADDIYTKFKQLGDKFKSEDKSDRIISLKDGESLESFLSSVFDWINIDTTEVSEAIVEINSKQEITLQSLIEDDIEITEADVRDFKTITNKFKVAMLLQAKSRLNTVLKLCTVLDKLYDELVNRIDVSMATTDTASLMYTTDYIAKALNETNQFIMSLITNEKLQNFFIIDNSNIINISNDRVDINKREKIRKAAEIVIDNIDYFSEGKFDKVKNPNKEEVSEEDKNADNATKSNPV